MTATTALDDERRFERTDSIDPRETVAGAER